MTQELQSQKIAILAADGVERIELEQPRGALHGAGAITELLSIHDGEIRARQKDLDEAATFQVEKLVAVRQARYFRLRRCARCDRLRHSGHLA